MNQIEIRNASWKSKFKKAVGSVAEKKDMTSAAIRFGRNIGCAGLPEPVVFLLLDVSISMKGKPLEFAKQGAVQFAGEAHGKGYRIGIISFGSQARLIAKPTGELERLSESINSLCIDGSTNMADGLFKAHTQLKDPLHADTSVVLVTDGYPNDPDKAFDVARSLKNRKIHILTLGTEDADFEFLKLISTSDKLAHTISTEKLISGMTSMAKLLPGA